MMAGDVSPVAMFLEMEGGVFPNPKFPYQKKLRFLLDFFCQKGGGVSPIPRGFLS